MQVRASHEWFMGQNKRAMITSRSSFSGMGKYGSRWLGDNESTWQSMGLSVTGIMMNNIMGIPLAGADICGFRGESWLELCTRWYQVGAFYPFSRNHNIMGSRDQEPWAFANDHINGTSYPVLAYIRNAMLQKYALLPYYYTEMSLLSENGGTFYQPPFFEFPLDKDAQLNLTHNVMLGKHIKISHQAKENETHVKSHYYFPEGVWCSVFNRTIFAGDGNSNCITGPVVQEMDSYYWLTSWVHLRDGGIVPMVFDVLNQDDPSTLNNNTD